MYSVLVPVDRDETRAYHQAKYVARLPRATEDLEVTVLFVVPPDEFEDETGVAFDEIDAAVEAADYLEGEGVAVTQAVDDGSVSEEIVRTADDLDADEIVVGGRQHSGVTQVLLGSTAQDVILSAERPVTVTGENVVFGEGLRHVLLPVDGSSERATHQAEYVTSLPGPTEDLEATVLTVFRHQDYKGAPPHEFEEVEAAVEAADYLESEGVAVERVGVGGEVAETILEHAEAGDVDGIVMTGRKRSGLQKALLGSTVQDVLLSAERPVTVTG